MNYNDYKRARDLAWLVLIRMGVTQLPVVVSSICKAYGFMLYSYEQGRDIISMMKLQNRTYKTDGFTTYHMGKYFIFYNGSLSNSRLRFTIAHELGHILLDHVPRKQGEATAINREPSPNDNPQEQQANVFASRLLAPACVLHGLGISSAQEISEYCKISNRCAAYRAERIELLNNREQKFLKQRGTSNYGMSNLERQVMNRFTGYIERNRVSVS